MKVHFGGSVKKFKQYPEPYILITKIIKDLGHELLRDWVTDELNGNSPPLELVYEYTSSAIKNADAVILENSLSSTSVGQQLMLALQNNVPILLLRNANLSTKSGDSLFIDKNLIKLVNCKKYNEKNIKMVIQNFLDKKASQFSVARFNLVLEKNLDKYLRNLARKNNTSKTAEIRKLIVEKMFLEAHHT